MIKVSQKVSSFQLGGKLSREMARNVMDLAGIVVILEFICARRCSGDQVIRFGGKASGRAGKGGTHVTHVTGAPEVARFTFVHSSTADNT